MSLHPLFRLFPGLALNVSRSGVTASVGRPGAWLKRGPREARATVGIACTDLSYSEQSPWARPMPDVQRSAQPPASSGIEVAELPRIEIEVPSPAAGQRISLRSPGQADDEAADPRLVPIAILIVALIASAAVLWALLA